MVLRKTGRLLSAFFMAATPTFAAGWEAVVVGQSASSAPKAFADAFNASDALRRGGFDTVQMLRDVPAASVLSAIAALEGTDRAVFYFSGPLDGQALRFADTAIRTSDILTRLADAGVTQAAILIEDCANPVGVSAFSAPPIPSGVEVFFATTAGPDGACGELPERMTDKLQFAQADSLQDALEGVWLETTLATNIPLSVQEVPVVPAAAAPVISIVSSTVAPVAAVAQPVQTAPTLVSISPPAAAPQAQGGSRTAGSVVTFAAPTAAQLAAIPAAAGLPEPSIIVGIIENASLEFDQVAPPADVTSSEVSYDNLEARRNLRDTSPDLFETLVSSGAFDPPEPLLATALQTELARMRCYTSAIDGIWGRGSRSSVERYFAEIPGVSAVSLEPEIPLFRQIIRQDDIVCAAPAAATASRPAATTTRRTTSSPTRTQSAPAPKRQAAPAPKRQAKPAPSTGGRKIRNNRLGGVFR